MGVRERHARKGVRSEKFAAMARKTETRGAGTLGVIEQCGAGLFDREFSQFTGIRAPKLECGAGRRDLVLRWMHGVACSQA